MQSTFCLTGASRERPSIHAVTTGIRIHMAGVSLSWDWDTASLIAQEIDRLRALELRRVSLEKFPETP